VHDWGIATSKMAKVGRCRLTLSNPRLKEPGTVRLRLTYGRLLSSCAFKLCFQIQLAPLHQAALLLRVPHVRGCQRRARVKQGQRSDRHAGKAKGCGWSGRDGVVRYFILIY